MIHLPPILHQAAELGRRIAELVRELVELIVKEFTP
jgi:hypothetical protein